jgi:ketosteroid isomerase-like protein
VGQFTRQEIEEAFEQYQRNGEKAGQTGDWSAWADHFTSDATYFEHGYGRFNGREEIRAWIGRTMSTYPGNKMPAFPVEWYVIDVKRGWVVCYIQNRMEDPGDGSIHQSPNVTILHYAGDGLWSYEEDVYNPSNFVPMLEGWQKRVKELSRG